MTNNNDIIIIDGCEIIDMHDPQIIYIGDPMCSWCYGISNEMLKVNAYTIQNKIKFTMLQGGLRAGGGQAWNAEFKQFLASHWQQVSARTGQQFGDNLFKLEQFDYDTEPACRAVVAVKHMVDQHPQNQALILKFFEAISQKFYQDNQDPKQVGFYQSICLALNLDYTEFAHLFTQTAIKQQTNGEFTLTRKWGVTGYPSLIFSDGKSLSLISSGYQKFNTIKQAIEHSMA